MFFYLGFINFKLYFLLTLFSFVILKCTAASIKRIHETPQINSGGDALELLFHVDIEYGDVLKAISDPQHSINAMTVMHSAYKYAILIDAGSTGSRIFVYQYHFDKDPHGFFSIQNLVIDIVLDKHGDGKPLVRKIFPGISSLAGNTSMAAEYLFELIDQVIDRIPADNLAGTPLFIMATAGLRLLQPEKTEAILEDCRRDIALRYPQLLFPSSHVEVISGKMEGIFAWISVNYILGNFKTTQGSKGYPTVGILDMGGGSFQIAYQIPFDYRPKALDENIIKTGLTELIHIINLSNYPSVYKISQNWLYKVYVATFLGFGVNEAIDSYRQSLIDRFLTDLREAKALNIGGADSIDDTTIPRLPIKDPCYPRGQSYNLTKLLSHSYHRQLINSKDGRVGWTLQLPIKGTGDFRACKKAMIPLLRLHEPCSIEPCSFNGIHQPPPINQNLEFYALSEFFYTPTSIGAVVGAYDAANFKKSAENVCANGSRRRSPERITGGIRLSDTKRMVMEANRCAKSAWISVVLHDGLAFPQKSSDQMASIRLISTIKGKEAHWTLGALVSEIFNARNQDMNK